MATLEADGISVGYRNHLVVQNVSLTLDPGEFLSLIGPNGAGKTTLLSALGGQLRIRSGSLRYDGQTITTWSADRRARAGIGRSFQAIHLFPNLTAEQNVRLAVQATRKLHVRDWLWQTRSDVLDATKNTLSAVGLEHVAPIIAKSLSHGDKRKLELAMLLALQPRILLLDEPTAGMSLTEAPKMLDLIEQLKSLRQYAIILVEHKVDVVMKLSDRIMVLNQGKVLAEGSPSEVMKNPEVTQAYLGGSHGSTA
ncbi:MAG: ABC transporter ATP-binding protein [Acidibacillus sp.]|uniref:Lipopolysaccharide export system ATP-binding protein LptB n=1 Tax=Sulfoacidibacillus ferrooxidans TaxID=2005001 RepID=A0A9X2AC33_9BACL|nr:Lipopolysaccharide export system ATP-binding protein LptB [Sulfoacidibacillus ferrooxidans]MCY0892205.1 ABC transporter ATP-binding protein [Acidibacillus sp.]